MNNAPLTNLLWSSGGPAATAAAMAAALVLALALIVARRRAWPLSFRRALAIFLTVALGDFALWALPADVAGSARPAAFLFLRVLAGIGCVEALQGIFFDLLLSRLLRRPAAPRILRDLLTIAAAVAFLAIALRQGGVNLSSILATSAMISIVLGLALQDTLGSFFAGLALQMESPLELGDWIRIADFEGQVTQVTWRSVRIRTPEEDEVTVPNALIARSVLLNYNRPTRAHMHVVDVRVHFRHPPQEVIAACDDAMRRTPGVLAAPACHTLLWSYGPAEIVYRARFYIDDYLRVNRIKGAVGAGLWYRLRRAGIEIPFPELALRRPAPPPGEPSHATVEGALDAAAIFGPLSAEERALLARHLRPALFGRGEAIIRQGDAGDSLFVITRGQVEVRVSEGNAEGVVGHLAPGSVFGEMSLLTGQPCTATVVATDDTEVVAVAREDFRRVVAANPAVLEAVARVVSDRRGQLQETIRETEEASAARDAAHLDLLERVRAFFAV